MIWLSPESEEKMDPGSVVVLGSLICGAIGKAVAARKDRQLMVENPEAWAAKKKAEEEAEERKRKAKANAALIALKVGSLFFRK